MFLSRLIEINDGCEKFLPVSESLWSNLKFFRMMDFTPQLAHSIRQALKRVFFQTKLH